MNLIGRLLLSFLFAFNGILLCLKKERNFIIQFLIMLAVVALAFYTGISFSEWIALLVCFSLVLCLEMTNSAIEQLCNFIHEDFHPSIGKIKDISAGAVFLASLLSMIIGLIIFIPKLFIS